MAKIKYDVKGVDPKSDRKLPKPGVYRCKIISCVDAKPADKDRRLEVQYEITEGDNKGFVLYDYINLESEAASWKLAQFIQAIGLGPKGTLDPDKLVGTALSIRTRLQAETEQWPAKAVPATLMPLDGEDDEDEDLDDDDETADDDDDADDADDSGGDEDDEDDEDDDEEDWTEEELLELDKAELFEVAEEYEIETPTKLTAKAKAKLVAEILEAQGGDEDDEDEDEDEDDDDDVDYSAMDVDELTEAAEENDLDLTEILGKGKKKLKGAKAKKALIAALEAMGDEDEDEDDDDEDEDDESPDYESMELKALKALAKERDLDTKGSKKVIIARLQKDDEPF